MNKVFHKHVAIALLLAFGLLWTNMAQSAIVALYPTNAEEYARVYSNQPSEFQTQVLTESRIEGNPDYIEIKSSHEFEQFLQKTHDRLIVMVGHNERGNLILPSGDSIPIQTLTSRIIELDKMPIPISCGASCYTQAPATERNISLPAALALATAFHSHFWYQNVPRGHFRAPPSASSSSRPGAKQTTTRAVKCRDLFSESPRQAKRNEREKTIDEMQQFIRNFRTSESKSTYGKEAAAATAVAALAALAAAEIEDE